MAVRVPTLPLFFFVVVVTTASREKKKRKRNYDSRRHRRVASLKKNEKPLRSRIENPKTVLLFCSLFVCLFALERLNCCVNCCFFFFFDSNLNAFFF